ncbi:MAG: RNA polymerase sigma factor [Kineosporiaceae bacterium]
MSGGENQASGTVPAARSAPDVLPPEVRRRFAAGDTAALGEVFARYERAVWSVAVRVTGSDHLAQEAVQETFVRAWRVAGTYDPSRDLGPWLLGVARFAALDVVRAEARPTRGGHAAETDASVEAPGIDRAWLAWAVQEGLRGLPDHEREIVRLAFFEDLGHAQISERLGIPVGTVKSRLHRANRRLADALAHLRGESWP